MILCYITCKDRKEAKHIAGILMGEKLIACANIFPIDSLYFWKGKLCDDAETVLLAKTQDKHWVKLKGRVEQLHSYEVPCIIKLQADANEAFASWIEDETSDRN